MNEREQAKAIAAERGLTWCILSDGHNWAELLVWLDAAEVGAAASLPDGVTLKGKFLWGIEVDSWGNVETDLAAVKDSYDWREALSVSFRDDRGVLGDSTPSDEFALDDIEAVLASSEGENEEASWLALFALKDGRLAYVDAWCDYTGWG